MIIKSSYGDTQFARINLNNNIEKLTYGSYLVEIRFEPAPVDRFPRQRLSSLPVCATQKIGDVYRALQSFVKVYTGELGIPHTNGAEIEELSDPSNN